MVYFPALYLKDFAIIIPKKATTTKTTFQSKLIRLWYPTITTMAIQLVRNQFFFSLPFFRWNWSFIFTIDHLGHSLTHSELNSPHLSLSPYQWQPPKHRQISRSPPIPPPRRICTMNLVLSFNQSLNSYFI